MRATTIHCLFRCPFHCLPPEHFISGCRPHSCDEKAAAILDLKTPQLWAVALRHFHCHMVLLDEAQAKEFGTRDTGHKRPNHCDAQATLTIYVVRRPPPARPDFAAENARVAHLREWARKAGYAAEELRIIESADR